MSLGDALADRIDQRPAAQRFVRHDQDRGHSRRSEWLGDKVPAATGLTSAGGLKIPCTAPGTPYSYGPPTTVGTVSKLKIGGGEDTCHSSVSARHGFAGARGPP